MLGLVSLTRPIEWSKTFGNMVIAALIASNFTSIDWQLFLIGFIAAGPLLWGGLYALNDWVDYERDKLHSVKRERPIPSGAVSPTLALYFSSTLIFLAFLIGAALVILMQNYLFIVCLFAMLLNQLLYTTKPFNFKRRAGLDLVSGSLINPFFRFYAGWVLFQQNFNAPVLILIFILGLQFGGYALYRLSGKKLEQGLGYKSSIVLFGENSIKLLSYAAIGIGGIAFAAASLTGVLPFKFIWLVLGSLLLLPLYWNTMKDPQKMNMQFVYKLIYLHYILFIAGFILLAIF